jgi:hypothetical protein
VSIPRTPRLLCKTRYSSVRDDDDDDDDDDNSVQFNSILYYLCAESTATGPITDTAQYRYT